MIARYRAAIAGTVIAALAVALIVACVLTVRADDAAAAAAGADWQHIPGPSTSVGGASLYTTCRSRERLWLTLGPDGAPAGPVTIDPYPC